jgi:serine protease Do
VIGVNTAIFSPSGGSIGIGFAIPAVMARNVVDSLRRFGEVQRGWLGVRIQTVTEELAEGLRLPAAKGALVASVVNDGPAASGGIQQGDVILRFDGREVPEMQPLPRMVAETPVDKEVEVVVWRKGREVKLRIVLGKLEEAAMVSAPADGGVPDDALAGTVDALGLKLALTNDELRQQFGLDAGTEGVVITEVVPDGSGAEKGLQPGDVIVEIDQDEVKTPAEVAERVAQARRDGYRVVTLLVLRGADYQWVAVRIDQG